MLKFFEVLPSHTLYSLPWRLVPSLAPCFYPMIKTKYLVMNSEMRRVNFLVCSAECWTNSYHDEPSVMHLFDYNSQESLLLLQFWSDLNQLAHNDRLHITVTCELDRPLHEINWCSGLLLALCSIRSLYTIIYVYNVIFLEGGWFEVGWWCNNF